jgi:hypothetical protein
MRGCATIRLILVSDGSAEKALRGAFFEERMMPIDFEPVDYGSEQIPYDDAVVEGRNLVSSMKERQFELGRIAAQVESKYEDKTLEHLAEAIGIDYGTLKSYRTTYVAWKDQPARPVSFSVAKTLNPHPRRAEIIQEKPDMSVKEAEEIMRELKKQPSAGGKRKKRRSGDEIGQIIGTLDNFLSEESELTGAIIDICDDSDADPHHREDIVEALAKASLRINTLIESIFHTSRSNTVAPEPEAEVDASEGAI